MLPETSTFHEQHQPYNPFTAQDVLLTEFGYVFPLVRIAI